MHLVVAGRGGAAGRSRDERSGPERSPPSLRPRQHLPGMPRAALARPQPLRPDSLHLAAVVCGALGCRGDGWAGTADDGRLPWHGVLPRSALRALRAAGCRASAPPLGSRLSWAAAVPRCCWRAAPAAAHRAIGREQRLQIVDDLHLLIFKLLKIAPVASAGRIVMCRRPPEVPTAREQLAPEAVARTRASPLRATGSCPVSLGATDLWSHWDL